MIRLSAAEALIRFLAAQEVEHESHRIPYFGGLWGIFGHGNVGGLGQVPPQSRLPLLRGQTEQGMGHAALSFAKAWRRKRAMAVTTSIGPGATNLVTAAATAHVNRLPILLLPADGFMDRRPDPVLQQLEHPLGPDINVNDCLRPVSRYFDRIVRPEQLVSSLPEMMRVMTDPAECGPVTVALPQDVQIEQAVFPASFFAHRVHRISRPPPDCDVVTDAAARLRSVERVLIIAGGGVRYSGAESVLRRLAESYGWPVAMTAAGKGALPSDHPLCVGAVGVCGTSAANALLNEADLVLAVGTRLTDFTTGSGRLFRGAELSLLSINISARDAHRRGGFPMVSDAMLGLEALASALSGHGKSEPWFQTIVRAKCDWNRMVDDAFSTPQEVPSDAEVLKALSESLPSGAAVVGASGGIPGDLQKLWPARHTDDYFLEYGFSCMGHEIAGALGVKLADPAREVWSLVGDGAYLMLSAELATSVSLHAPIRVLLLDNRGFGCIDRLDRSLSEAPSRIGNLQPERVIDFVAHARALGAMARKVSLSELAEAVAWSHKQTVSTVLVLETDATRGLSIGGAPWRVPSLDGGLGETRPRSDSSRRRGERPRSGMREENQ